MSVLYDSIYELVRAVPRGRVVTYGQIANHLGTCNARQVGYALSALKEGTDVPWYRVVNRKGEISLADPDGQGIQKAILKSEGITFDTNERINMDKFSWKGL